ncbi:transport system permease protein [Denitrovibrio acetiphilus DSM 12809]|uniref:Transport system permease protein n=1 Tax=Denitrovibrio acetiphilus (strain DSM 12809 / NBRC 114555 / N2460) TaxID=522772 RepID=D4H5I0_DENA2|nr:iron ABC transporter permease [Denitrovibrio acetiphilus]ADD67600.1 transport system permease protein [Denitrovibrio acetiphilus DSM 12809]
MTENTKRTITTAAGLTLLVAGFTYSVMSGTVNIAFDDFVRVFSGVETGGLYHVVMNIRIPRIIVGGLVGINLALSGAILQSILKNPLADPGIIGISSGAGLSAMFVMILYPAVSHLVPFAAFLGAMGTAALIYMLAYENGAHPLRLILAGVAISAFLGAFMTALMVLQSDKVQGTLSWMAGALNGRSWNHVQMILPYSVIGVLGAFVCGKYLNILALGDDVAKGLGMSVEKSKLFMVILATMLAASAVSVAGMLGFVGLIIPHITRLMVGSDNRILIPLSAVFGALTVIIADTVARTLFSPYELPVGVIMAFAGAPFFLYLLNRRVRK